MPPPVTNSNTSSNQSNSYDDQIYEIDIDKMYQDYIQQIDSVRSSVNIIGQQTSNLLSAIGGNINAPTANNLVPAKTPQESRCHAFFRLIGFPVVNADQSKFYNPGHDIIYGFRSLALSDKIAIAQNPIAGYTALSDFREQYPLNRLKIFSTTNAGGYTVDAGALALSGGANPAGKRLFASPFVNGTTSFDVDTSDQSYPANYTSIVGSGRSGSPGDGGAGYVQLTQYQDATGNMPTAASLPATRYHIIVPFIVDPRIDFTCSPSTNRIAVPFVPNKSFLQVSGSVYTVPPLIETIIRNKTNVTDRAQNSGDYTQQFATFIKNISTNPDESILGQINQNDIQQLAANTQFLQFVNIIQAMMIKLVEARKNINNAQSQYYWLPVPSNIGPEGGSTLQGVFLPNLIAKQLTTLSDGQILINTAQSLFSQTNQNPQASVPANITPDPGGLAVVIQNSFGPSSSSSYVNNSINTLDMLNNKRAQTLSQAGDALRIVEIIMGEFSGLGLCDIIAILGALYTMPVDNLWGFLDIDALNRMNAQYNQNFTAPGLSVAMDSFTSTVNQFYQLMDAIYQSVLTTRGVSV